MMLLLREHYEEPPTGSTLVSFGEHKGKRFDEVPEHYIQWATKEGAPSKSMRDLINWHSKAAHWESEKISSNRESLKNDSHSTNRSATSAGPSHMNSAHVPTSRSVKRSSASSEASSWTQVSMDASSAETKAKILELETQLAILRRDQGGSTPSDHGN